MRGFIDAVRQRIRFDQAAWYSRKPIRPADGRSWAGDRTRLSVESLEQRRLLSVSISGNKWNDQNSDGVWNAVEPALANWPVFLDLNDNRQRDDQVRFTPESTNVPRQIPDRSTVSSTLTVTGVPGPMLDLDVALRIRHSYDSDLKVSLVAPDGTTVQLFSAVGGSGRDFVNTIFDDGSSIDISAGSAPFASRYRPSQSLAAFNNHDPNGTWRLEIADQASGDTGTLYDWSLGITVAEPSTLTDGSGHYQFTGLPAGIYRVLEEQQSGWTSTFPDLSGASAAAIAATVPLTTTASTAPVYLLEGGSSLESLPGQIEPLSAGARSLIRLDQFRADPRFSGIDGHGYSAVVLDTGIDLDHPFFGPDLDHNGVADRIVFQHDYVNNDEDASDDGGHGSNVASIIGSQDSTYQGMAPGANLIALKVLSSDGTGNFGVTEQALQWVVMNASTYNIASVNMSLGDPGDYDRALALYGLADELAALASLGVVVVSASGNDFYGHNSRPGVSYPAADPNSLSVGAVWDASLGLFSWSGGAEDFSTGPDRLISFSQRDAVLTDVLAPGGEIVGAGPNGGLLTESGTSQASPHIAGIAVLAQQLAQQTLGRRLSLNEFRLLLRDSAVWVVDGDDEDDNVVNTNLSFPRVDLYALAEAILAYRNVGEHVVSLVDGQSAGSLNFGNYNPLFANRPPVLDPISAPGTINEGSTLGFTATAHDPDAGNALTFSLSSAPLGATIDPVTGQFAWTPTDNQSVPATFTVVVTDNGSPALSASQTLTVAVANVNPTLSVTGPGTGTAGGTVSFSLSAADPSSADRAAPFVYQVDWDNNGSFEDSVTGGLSVTRDHVYAVAGGYAPRFRVVDKDGGTSLVVARTITINPAPAPEIRLKGNNLEILDGDVTPSTADLTDFGSAVITGGIVTRTFTIEDIGSGTLNLTGNPRVSLSGPGAADFSVVQPSGSAISPGGSLTFQIKFDPSQVGTRTAMVSIANDDSNENPYDFAIQGAGTPPPNQPPVLSAISHKSVNELASLSFQATATDPEGQTLSFALLPGAPAGATINASTGAFFWQPTESDGPGIYSLTVEVTDGGSPPLSASRTFQVSVGEVNQAPQLALIENRTATVGSLVTFTAQASDADLPTNTLTFSLDPGAPLGAVIGPTTGVFSFTPSQTGPFNVTVRVADNGTPGLAATRTFSIDVVSSNRPPVLAALGNQSLGEGSELSFTASASDPDPGQALVYSLTGAPSGAAIDPVSGQFRWTPTDNGTFTFTVRAADNGFPRLFDEESITVTVANLAPSVTIDAPRVVVAGQAAAFTIRATDPSLVDQNAGFRVKVDWNNDGVYDDVVDAPSPLVRFHVYDAPGTYVARFAVRDKDGAFAPLQSKTIDVLPSGASLLGLGAGTGTYYPAVSLDGSTVVGTLNDLGGLSTEAFRWRPSSGLQTLGDFPGGAVSIYGIDVSADGNVVTGYGYAVGDRANEAYRWTASTGIVGLGGFLGEVSSAASDARAISGDGSVVVGEADHFYAPETKFYHEAFRWSPAEGLVGLGLLPGDSGVTLPVGGAGTVANGVSADGRVVVGYGTGSSPGQKAFRWTFESGLVPLPDEGLGAGAQAISADGTTIVGYAGAAANQRTHAARWDGSGFRILDSTVFQGGLWGSFANAVSGDGTFVVGQGGEPFSVPSAVIWDDAHGVRFLPDLLSIDYGLDLSDWQLSAATDISADGRTVVGIGIHRGIPETWVATLPVLDEPEVELHDAVVYESPAGASSQGGVYGRTWATLSKPSDKPVVVHIASREGTATSDDYSIYGDVTFAPGEVVKPVLIFVRSDNLAESDESFSLEVELARGARFTPAHKSAIVSILADHSDRGSIVVSTGQQTGLQTAPQLPDVAVAATGHFVVVWQEAADVAAGSPEAIYAQRFSPDGYSVTPRLTVSSSVQGQSGSPRVAIDERGDFVVVWESRRSDGTHPNILARQFLADGRPRSNEFQVNSLGNDTAREPAVSMNGDGSFVVSFTNDQAGADVYVRRYDADGLALGTEQRVHALIPGTQSQSSVAIDAAGDFVVVWNSDEQGGVGGTGVDVYLRRFNAAGKSLGDEQLVNQTVVGQQRAAGGTAVSMDREGAFVVTWENEEPLSSPGFSRTYFRRYDSAGAPRDDEQAAAAQPRVLADQKLPAVSLRADGSFVIAWQSLDLAEHDPAAFAQSYDPQGMSKGGPIRLDDGNSGRPARVALASNRAGDLVSAWTGLGTGSFPANLEVHLFVGAANEQGPVLVPSSVDDLNQGPRYSNPEDLTLVSNAIYFVATDAKFGQELWQTDGTPNGTRAVADFDPSPAGTYPSQFTEVLGRLYFTVRGADGRDQIWRTASAAGGLELVFQSAGPGSFTATGLTNFGGQLFFSADDGVHGSELWRSNGLPGGTGLLQEINQTGAAGANGSAPSVLTVVGGKLYFTADDGIHGSELWQSDGTTAGTRMLADLAPGPAGSSPGQFVAVADRLFFTANDGAHGTELWRTDGTSASTIRLGDINPGAAASDPAWLTNVSGSLFFRAYNPVSGRELWKSDGSSAGTVLVSDIRPGLFNGAPLNSNVRELTNVGGALYFSAVTDAQRDELWKSDGTSSGTRLVADINPGTGGSAIGDLTVLGGTIYFTADDGVHGRELWKSDGTSSGTQLVADFETGSEGSAPRDLLVRDGVLYFSAFQSPVGREIWKLTEDCGPEWHINTYTANDQKLPQVAAAPDGRWVVVWTSFQQDGSSWGIYGQRYDSDGRAQGDEFRINQVTAGNQRNPAVAMASDGSFIVVWHSAGQDGSDLGIVGRRFAADGVPIGGEFLINTITAGVQSEPAVAIDAFGNWAVVWQSDGVDGSGRGVVLRRFAASGLPLDFAEVLVNQAVQGDQTLPNLAYGPDGGLVVVWQSDTPGASGPTVFARRYSPTGVSLGGALTVATLSASYVPDPAVVVTTRGEIVVGWSGFGLGDETPQAYLRRYAADGIALGSAVRINDADQSQIGYLHLAADACGQVLAVWQGDPGQGQSWEIFGRRFDRGGVALGSSFQVNTTVVGVQNGPTVAYDGLGKATVVWQGAGSGEAGLGIFGQRFCWPLTEMVFGDANGDGLVGAADYAVWAAEFGQTGSGLPGDFDGNGTVGAADYALWAANFGRSAGDCVTPTTVNQAPSFSLDLGGNLILTEDSPAQTIAGFAGHISPGADNESQQTLTFLVDSTQPGLYQVAPAIRADGTLTFWPAPNARGFDTITVRLKDNGGTANGGVDTSAPQTFTIVVVSVNDPPSFVPGGNVTVPTNAGFVFLPWATSITPGPADEAGQTVFFILLVGNPGLFSTQPALSSTGALTFAPNPGATGSTTVFVQLVDDGGTANGGVDRTGVFTFTLTVGSSGATAPLQAQTSLIPGDERFLDDPSAVSGSLDHMGPDSRTAAPANRADARARAIDQLFYDARRVAALGTRSTGQATLELSQAIAFANRRTTVTRAVAEPDRRSDLALLSWLERRGA